MIKLLASIAVLLFIISSSALALKKFHCFGTEPFWRLSTDNKSILFEKMGAAKMHLHKTKPIQGANHTLDYLRVYKTKTISSNKPAFIIILKTQCSDDMSDKNYKYHVTFILNNEVYDGCCNIK